MGLGLIKTTILALLVVSVSGLPAAQKFTPRQLSYYDLSRRQEEAAAASGLTDPDILDFALTLEHLEAAFYLEALTKFATPESLSLSASSYQSLHSIASTESTHVSLLLSALAQASIAPVSPCTYDFSAALSSPESFLATASVLENVGVSAYLGAAGLISDKAILSVAGSILTVEARHQTALRVFSKTEAIPQAFDAALGPRSVFSLAAPFIKSCPDGSNLAIEAFPALAMTDVTQKTDPGAAVQITSDAAAGATHCSFTSGGVSAGGTVFSTFAEGTGCVIPKTVAGVSYLALVNNAPLDGVLTDDIVVAGPIALTVT